MQVMLAEEWKRADAAELHVAHEAAVQEYVSKVTEMWRVADDPKEGTARYKEASDEVGAAWSRLCEVRSALKARGETPRSDVDERLEHIRASITGQTA